MSSLVDKKPKVLASIPDSPKQRKLRIDINGAMLYSAGNFLQVLQGAEEKVIATLQSIQADWRHYGIFVLVKLKLRVERLLLESWGEATLS